MLTPVKRVNVPDVEFFFRSAQYFRYFDIDEVFDPKNDLDIVKQLNLSKDGYDKIRILFE